MYFYPLNLEELKKGIIQGVILGLVSYPVELAITDPSMFFSFINSFKTKKLPHFRIDPNDPVLKDGYLRVGILGPIQEDIISNGLILQSIQLALEYFGVSYAGPIAIAANAIIFSLMHDAKYRDRVSCFLGGLEFGALAYLNQSLWPSTVAHIVTNSFQYALLPLGIAIEHEPVIKVTKVHFSEQFVTAFREMRENADTIDKNKMLKNKEPEDTSWTRSLFGLFSRRSPDETFFVSSGIYPSLNNLE